MNFRGIRLALNQMGYGAPGRECLGSPSLSFLSDAYLRILANPYWQERRELKREFWDIVLFEPYEIAAKKVAEWSKSHDPLKR